MKKKMQLPKSKPLSQQVYELLREQIADMTPGDNRLLAEEDLAKQLGVSRATIREAMKSLSFDRLISSIHGRGTFAHPSVLKMENRIDVCSDFGKMLEDGYGDVSVDVKWKYADEGNALFKEMLGDRSAVYTWWLYQAGGKKRLYSRFYLNREDFVQLPEDELKIHSLPELSKGYMRECIECCVMRCVMRTDEDACRQLGVPEGTPLICWEEQLYDVRDNAVGVGEVFQHPDNMVMSVVTLFSASEE